jgi:tRNA pseudouridine55 synthase
MMEHSDKYAEGEMILIDKPWQWTSFDVVKKIRNTVKVKKVGHAGTLDPLATGLLIVCTGKMTRKIQDFQEMPKEYQGIFFLGATRLHSIRRPRSMRGRISLI